MADTLPGAMSILVIDDDEIMRELLSALLEGAGHRVVTAQGPAEGGKVLEQEQTTLDVVLTDLRMPDTDGPRMLETLRATMPAGVRLIGMSGSEAAPGELKHLDNFLLKPFTVDDFITAAGSAGGKSAQATETCEASKRSEVPVLDEAVYVQLSKALPEKALRELYDLTLEDVSQRAAAIREAAAAGNVSACKSEAHAMKGGCGMVGAAELRGLAADIETGAPVDNMLLNEIAGALERLRRMLSTLIS